MAKKNVRHKLPQTAAFFSVRGRMTKMNEDGFAKWNIKPKGLDGREHGYAGATFAVKTTEDNTIYGLEISGNESNTVRMSYKTADGKVPVEIGWEDRYDENTIKASVPQDADVSIDFAKTIGLEHGTYKDKQTNEEKPCVLRKKLTGFDAVHALKKAADDGKLADGTSVYMSGNIKISSYPSNKNSDGTVEMKRSTKFEINNFDITVNPIEFENLTDDEKFFGAKFTMDVIVKGFEEYDGVTYMTGIYVGYSSIEELQFKFSSEEYAAGFRRIMESKLKKGVYPKIRCVGGIIREFNEEEIEEVVVTEDDELSSILDPKGRCKERDKTRRGPSVVRWVIDGAEIKTLDETTYTPENIAEAKEQVKAWLVDNNAGKDLSNKEENSGDEDLSVLAGNIKKSETNFDDIPNDDDWEF